ncbi:hypothetical protein DDIC_03645 [Desulfovibrio desulfuricans]|uniref:Uncharacterized protein n=1 Tax=Desulfovibrio desulfuricans TaxID=876 RepID=A0A4P7UHN8_DESDE|nr:hypothetical protein [Desulfovibrio desulfuricans]QCC84987.1 hypothetical protein DDIC_03645 [Desulfovibrio desulfuricans]
MAGVGLFAKYAFFGLTRKNPVLERSVLMYVSIKNRILTQFRPKKSGLRKSARRAHTPADDALPALSQSFSTICPQIFAPACTQLNHEQRGTGKLEKFVRHQKQVVAPPSLYSPEQREGDGWCWAICKIRIFRPDKEKSCF